MKISSRSFVALGLLGSGVLAALGALRTASYNKREESRQDAAINAWENEGGSSQVRSLQETSIAAEAENSGLNEAKALFDRC